MYPASSTTPSRPGTSARPRGRSGPGQQPADPLGPRAHPRRPLRELAREQRGLGALARAVLGHPAADLGFATAAPGRGPRLRRRALSERAGRDLGGLDLHRPYVDEVTWTCRSAGRDGPTGARRRRLLARLRSMPVAQWHSFENREPFMTAGQAIAIARRRSTRPGMVLHAPRGVHFFDRPASRTRSASAHPRHQGREDVEVAGERGRSLAAPRRLRRRRDALVHVRLGAAVQPSAASRLDHVEEVLQFVLTL